MGKSEGSKKPLSSRAWTFAVASLVLAFLAGLFAFSWDALALAGMPAQDSAPARSLASGGRWFMDQAAPTDDLAQLLELAKAATVAGDGYDGRERPFTPTEIFTAATPAAVAKWAMRQPEAGGTRQRAIAQVRLLVKYSRIAINAIEDAFGFQMGDLGFDFIHLTCRHHDPLSTAAARDSHPAHADNCFFKGIECIRASPMYHWRSHSAILSLNGPTAGDFEGGDFYFVPLHNSDPSMREQVTPKAGLLTAFTAGVENVHGVGAVTRGTRCQLSMWMTDDLKRATHTKELQSVEEILSGKLLAPVRNTFGAHFGSLCQRAVINRVSASGDVQPSLALQLPGEHRVSVKALNDLPGPQISEIRGLLTQSEIDHFIMKASPNFKAAVVFEGGSITTASYRTSTSSWLKDDPKDKILSRVLERIKLVTGLSLISAEELQLAHYTDKNEGKYEPHYDWGTRAGVTRAFSYNGNGEPVGARIATLLMYLAAPESGGETAFIELNKTVTPEAGTGILFYDLLPSSAGDENTLHGGCPVLQGDKIIMTKWFHELGNEALFDAGEGQPQFARDWQSLSDKLRGIVSHREPLLLGKACETRWASGECKSTPLKMTRACPGLCEEHLLKSEVRGRNIFESVITAVEAQAILELAASPAMIIGDGYGGKPRPHSSREVLSGLSPSDAALWAVSQPEVGGRRAMALSWARAFLRSASEMWRVIAGAFEQDGELLLDAVRLVCRRAVMESDHDVDNFNMRNTSISGGSDLLVATMTPSEAIAKCLAMADCKGFTYQEVAMEQPALIYFKNKQDLYEHGYGWTAYLRRVDLEIPDSHPPHADNCYKHGRDCMAGAPQLPWRSHSAVLFLNGPENGDFAGGSFFYSPTWDSPMSERIRVVPQRGRMVTYTAGPGNIHGVEEVTKGIRCAINIWATRDAKHAQAARELESAEGILGGDSA